VPLTTTDDDYRERHFPIANLWDQATFVCHAPFARNLSAVDCAHIPTPPLAYNDRTIGFRYKTTAWISEATSTCKLRLFGTLHTR
jgi:hypothetical protein